MYEWKGGGGGGKGEGGGVNLRLALCLCVLFIRLICVVKRKKKKRKKEIEPITVIEIPSRRLRQDMLAAVMIFFSRQPCRRRLFIFTIQLQQD